MEEKVLTALMQVIVVHHSDVTSLSFANCKLDARKAVLLKEDLFASTWVNKILHINLSHNEISDKWVSSFKTIVKQQEQHTLEILELSFNNLGVFTGTQFPFFLQPDRLPLRVLTLDGNSIGDQGFDILF